MISGILGEPWWLIVWIAWLGTINLASLAFLREIEARWVLTAFLASLTTMVLLEHSYGYNRFLGLAHVIFWTPLLLYLYRRLARIVGPPRYENWLRTLLASNGISLLIDYVDVLRYLTGDRS